MSRQPLKQLYFALILALFASNAVFAQNSPITTKSKVAKVKVTSLKKLCAMEQKLATTIASEGKTAATTLNNLYERENQEFISHIQNMKTKAENSDDKSRGISLISAPAAFGKSFFIKPLLQNIIKKDYVKISLRDDVFESKTPPFSVSQRMELSMKAATNTNSDILSLLPYFEPKTFRVEKLLFLKNEKSKKNPKFIIIDDFDEIHPETTIDLLKSLYTYVYETNQDKAFLQIIILGRPEAFMRFSENPLFKDKTTLIQLKSPKILNKAELAIRIQNYIDFNKKTNINLKEITDKTAQILKEKPFLTSIMGNLGLSDLVINYVAENNKRDIKDVLFDFLLERGDEKHNRPSEDKNKDYFEPYKMFFEQIALDYKNKIDENGFFEVNNGDQTTIIWSGTAYTAYTSNILERSSLVLIIPVNNYRAKYRFEHIWLHKYLIERLYKRVIKKYKPKECN